jgi:hypothetical protein
VPELEIPSAAWEHLLTVMGGVTLATAHVLNCAGAMPDIIILTLEVMDRSLHISLRSD